MKPQRLIRRVAVGLALVAAVTAASSVRRGDGDSNDVIHDVLGEQPVLPRADVDMWPFHNDVPKGISFERTETSCPLSLSEDATAAGRLLQLFTSTMGYLLRYLPVATFVPESFSHFQSTPRQTPHATFDNGHCKSSDRFGGNDCHFSWGDELSVTYDGRLNDTGLGGDAYLELAVKVDGIIRHRQTCSVCGEDCRIHIAGIPKSWSIKMPPCPITSEMLAGKWKAKLPAKNPIPALFDGMSGTVVEGTIWLKRRKGQGDDEELLMVKGNAHLK
ncbi:hypothetical protein ACHAXT_006774 [Thalassiosira profunda]